MSVDETIIAWVGDEEVGEGDPVKVVAKVLDVLRRKTDLFLQENVEKKIWELIKVNRRKARAGGEGVKKGFLFTRLSSAFWPCSPHLDRFGQELDRCQSTS